MSTETFLKYLNKEDLLTVLPDATSKVKNSSEDEIRKLILKNLKSKKITATKIRKLWTQSVKIMFFDVYQKAFHFTPTKKFDTTTKLKNVIQKHTTSAIYSVKIGSKPLHYAIFLTSEPVTDFIQFLLLPLQKQIFLSIFPEIGYSMCCFDKDKYNVKMISEVLSSSLENLNEVKVNALLLRKYSTQETISKLVISTPQEIAGFSGLDVIEFKGPNVVIGLSGLKRRHDANVDVITRVGPFTEIESANVNLICGKGIKIKNYEGIDIILKTFKT